MAKKRLYNVPQTLVIEATSKEEAFNKVLEILEDIEGIYVDSSWANNIHFSEVHEA